MQASYCHTCEASQKRIPVPHRPHATVSSTPGVGHESSLQVPLPSGAQVSSHLASRVCPAGQSSDVRTDAPGTHVPSPVHAPAPSQTHEALQRCGCVPHWPHAPDRSSPGVQAPTSPSQGP